MSLGADRLREALGRVVADLGFPAEEIALERPREALDERFLSATREFLAKRPERIAPEMAFLMTFLLLMPDGLHRVSGTQ